MKTEVARCAAEIRKILKAKNIKASVRSKSYSMGSSVNVEIKEIIDPGIYKGLKEELAKYQYGHFDGMIDLYEYSNNRDDIPQCKFLFIEYSYSLTDGFIQRLINVLVTKINLDADYEYKRLAGDILYGRDDWMKWEEVKHLANLEVA
tara:strand:- start:136 stop:579 length:444 start_codon:yes stop_codon:yes gene_type:complete